MTHSRRTTTYLESTDVPASRSAEEIRDALVRAGARQIATEYGDAGQITGLSWSMRVEHTDVQFKLPARVTPVYNLLKQAEAGKSRPTDKTRLQAKAERIAWRQLYAWTRIQEAEK